jgi:hypothetical protein
MNGDGMEMARISVGPTQSDADLIQVFHYIDPASRERQPRFVIDDNGKERLTAEGKLLGHWQPPLCRSPAGRARSRQPEIDAAFRCPRLGLFTGAVEDPGLAAAMCLASNRWLTDYCKPYPDRLFGVAMLEMQSVELAMEELRHVRETLGMRRGFLRPNPSRQEDAQRPDVRTLLADGRRSRRLDQVPRGLDQRMPTGAPIVPRTIERRGI